MSDGWATGAALFEPAPPPPGPVARHARRRASASSHVVRCACDVEMHSLPRGTLFETDDGVLGVSLGRDGARHEVAFLAPTINAGMAVPMDSLALVRLKKVA